MDKKLQEELLENEDKDLYTEDTSDFYDYDEDDNSFFPDFRKNLK